MFLLATASVFLNFLSRCVNTQALTKRPKCIMITRARKTFAAISCFPSLYISGLQGLLQKLYISHGTKPSLNLKTTGCHHLHNISYGHYSWRKIALPKPPIANGENNCRHSKQDPYKKVSGNRPARMNKTAPAMVQVERRFE